MESSPQEGRGESNFTIVFNFIHGILLAQVWVGLCVLAFLPVAFGVSDYVMILCTGAIIILVTACEIYRIVMLLREQPAYHAILTNEGGGDDDEEDVMAALILGIKCLVGWACAHFGLVWISFYLADKGALVAIWAIIIGETAAGIALQRRARNMIEHFEEKPSHARYAGTAKSFSQPYKVPVLGVTIAWVTKGTASLLLGAYDLSDPSSDAANAGQAGRVVTEEGMGRGFAAGWHGVLWGAGSVIEEKGLPWCLTFFLIVSTSFQFLSFTKRLQRAAASYVEIRTWRTTQEGSSANEERAWAGLWTELAKAADLVSLNLVSSLMEGLANKHGVHDKGAVRISRAFLVKLPENVPATWLCVTMLALTWDTSGADGLAMNIYGILTSMVSLAVLGNDVIAETREKMKADDVQSSLKARYLGMAVVILAQIAFIMLATAVRVAGVARCPSHIFNLSSASCVTI